MAIQTKKCLYVNELSLNIEPTHTLLLQYFSDVNALELCECLSAIGSIDGALLQSLVPDVAAVLRTLINLDCDPDLMVAYTVIN